MTIPGPGQPQSPDPYGQQPSGQEPYGGQPYTQGPSGHQPYEQPAGGPGSQNPGKTLGIVGLVLSILGCTALIGIVVSVIGLVKSRKAGLGNGLAWAGIIIGVLWLVIGGIGLATGVGGLMDKCSELGPGTHQVDGVTYTCP
ncbi:hypothetical protein [Myceligenerans crystallogenes]|uniref:DUF4190 domain-containing protein n=1 Tax=Myceligenerans crystallogenes TaxID=316335 RepID=A0ABN2N3V3_9MICO